MKNRLPDYRPSRRQVATSIGILVLAAAGFSFNAIDTTPDQKPCIDNKTLYYNTTNQSCTDPDAVTGQPSNDTDQNQSESNQTESLPDNLTQSDSGNNTNTS